MEGLTWNYLVENLVLRSRITVEGWRVVICSLSFIFLLRTCMSLMYIHPYSWRLGLNHREDKNTRLWRAAFLWKKYKWCKKKMSQMWSMLDNGVCSRGEGKGGGEEWLDLRSNKEQFEKLPWKHEIWIHTWKKWQGITTDAHEAIWHRMRYTHQTNLCRKKTVRISCGSKVPSWGAVQPAWSEVKDQRGEKWNKGLKVKRPSPQAVLRLILSLQH